jgi:hypothetical protein
MKRFAAVTMLSAAIAIGAGAQGVRQNAVNSPLPQQDRAQLEARFRQQMARRARTELGLTDDQMRRLQETHRKFAQNERALDMSENQTRRALRDALMGASSADQERQVGELQDRLLSLQRQRLDLVAAEQKELGAFLTNVQRVRFQALQENFRRQMLDATRPADAPPLAGRRGRPPV